MLKPCDLLAEVWDKLLKMLADSDLFVSINKINNADIPTLSHDMWEMEGATPTIDCKALKLANVTLVGPYSEISTEIDELEQWLVVLRGLHNDFKQLMDRTAEIMQAERLKCMNEDLQNLIEAAQKCCDDNRRAMLESFGMAMPTVMVAPPPLVPAMLQCGIR
ncbi:uncharacterized protein ACA1_056880 [Acanthamoeba castellanii str. Neff]|uniref:Uncharacterized protein n=1 Tax=Acanthamoeba castellanii (strain ATCC 30010 / Neff) TaxID=1257118 RepID=L8GVU5_ACACF|nr:uncharacterized protein ACA1_056880 [Acanthamoeba castellanii str. Neff]ELR17057.1 hypothetical protein ACA1_056880 [Acanthamoeba castellanii str. Neff]